MTAGGICAGDADSLYQEMLRENSTFIIEQNCKLITVIIGMV